MFAYFTNFVFHRTYSFKLEHVSAFKLKVFKTACFIVEPFTQTIFIIMQNIWSVASPVFSARIPRNILNWCKNSENEFTASPFSRENLPVFSASNGYKNQLYLTRLVEAN